MRRYLIWAALCSMAFSVPSHADPVSLSFQVEPGGATLQDRDTGEPLATATADAIGTFKFSAEPGVHHYRIERTHFDDMDVTFIYHPDGRWQFQSASQKGWLDEQTLLMLSCHVRLALHPTDTRVYIDSEAPNATDEAELAPSDLEIGGLRRHVRPLQQTDGKVRIPNGWNPPLLYLVHPGFESRMLQIPAGALDTLPSDVYPPSPIQMRPLYGPFSYPAFNASLIGVLVVLSLWAVPAMRSRARGQALKNALLDDILSSRRPTVNSSSKIPGLTEHTVCTDSGVRYLLLNKLGQGAMGAVYEAIPVGKSDRERVAVKVLSRTAWSQNEARERFKREVHICQTLQHPAIVKVLDWGVWESDEATGGAAPFMIMELVHGRTLRAVMDGHGPVDAERVVEWLLDILKGLRVAHQAGVIHRDIKPENLMVTASNRIKIMDFGIARLQGSEKLTATGGQLGTPAYMSLEHLQAKNVVPSSDIYSLGVVAFELVVGHRPFNESDIWALVGRLLTEEPPHPIETNPHVPVDLDHVIWTMLARRPEDRYPDCDAVIAALEERRSEQTTIG